MLYVTSIFCRQANAADNAQVSPATVQVNLRPGTAY